MIPVAMRVDALLALVETGADIGLVDRILPAHLPNLTLGERFSHWAAIGLAETARAAIGQDPSCGGEDDKAATAGLLQAIRGAVQADAVAGDRAREAEFDAHDDAGMFATLLRSL